jgi:hypothetical protein
MRHVNKKSTRGMPLRREHAAWHSEESMRSPAQERQQGSWEEHIGTQNKGYEEVEVETENNTKPPTVSIALKWNQ